MPNNLQNTWAVSLKERGKLLFGTITHYGKLEKKEHHYEYVDDLYSERSGIDAGSLMMDAILSLIPNGEVTLVTPLPGYQGWLPIHKKSRLRLFYESWFVSTYVDILRLLRFVFRIKNQKLNDHIRNMVNSLCRENIEAFKKELKKDGITLVNEDYKGRCQLKLVKRQLPKYLEALGEHGGVPEHFDTIAVPKRDGIVWEEGDLESLWYTFGYGGKSRAEEARTRIESLMKDHSVIGILDEGFFFFLAYPSDKMEIIGRLNEVAAKYNLTTDLL